MTGAVKARTTNFKLAKINFNAPSWGDEANENMDLIDAVIEAATFGLSILGAWANSTAYSVGDRVVDVDEDRIYECEVAHTSAATGSFSDYRTANPTHWTAYGFAPRNRGAWTTGTAYHLNEIVSNGNEFAIVLADYTSGATYAGDVTNGDLEVLVDLDPQVNAAQASADAAAVSETNAAASASAAATSEGNAATSATNAANSASAAATSESNAATSATNAANSATAAATSETNAGTSETNAAASETAAAASASAAATSETNAAASEASAAALAAAVDAFGFRSKIINGDFDIWQRATSQTSSGYGSDDRWHNQNTGSTKTHSRQSFTLGQTDVPGNPTYYSRTVFTSVSGAANEVRKIHRIEGVRTLAGKTATLTFYAKADAAKNIAIELVQTFGTGGSPSAAVVAIGAQQVALTTSWQKFSVAVNVPSVSGKTLGSNGNDSLQVTFWFDAGSDFDVRASSLGHQSGTVDIAHVSLVEGDATAEADPFSPRHIEQEWALCLRYYEQSYAESVAAGTNTGVGQFITAARASSTTATNSGLISFTVRKRVIPTVTVYPRDGSPSGSVNFNSSASESTATVAPSVSDILINIDAGTGLTVNDAVTLFGHWTADAEL